DTLCLPHPGLASRVFVLRPFFDIAPDTAVPPHGKTVAALLGDLPDPSAGILVIRRDWLADDLSPRRTESPRPAPTGAPSR
ncbi:MAG: 2-amino-4-hydroxy-6-hydroxymethyldihydropteridine diphosphokinase, partial [Myxococcota bacterium]